MSDPKHTPPRRDETPKSPAAPLSDAALDAVSGGISAVCEGVAGPAPGDESLENLRRAQSHTGIQG